MHDDLRLPTAVSGAVTGFQPLIELVLIPVAVVVARRTAMMRLIVLGAAFGVGANLCFALTGSLCVGMPGPPQVFLAPALYGLVATAGIAGMSRSRHAMGCAAARAPHGRRP